jgi:pyruvate formate lyase activating enzyme
MENESRDYLARFWKSKDANRIVCTLCPRQCVLLEGQRGFCFVRQNKSGRMVLTTYGLNSGLCIDPIEKKPLHHFYPGTSVLSFGTAGCNLGCKFCQNWDLSRSQDIQRTIEKATAQDIVKIAMKYQCKSVAFTYNEPAIFAEYVIDVAKACRENGIKTVAVTAGYISAESRFEFFEHMDATNVDLKAFSDEFYQELAAGHLQPVLDTLVYLKKQTRVWIEITNLLIPGRNDSNEAIDDMTRWVVKALGPDVPLHFSAFHPAYKMMDYPPTPIATLKRAAQVATGNGIRYVYLGNVSDSIGGNTFCHHCRKLLIERDWYEIGKYHLKDRNHCEYCGTECAGHFDDRPGIWGSQRLAVAVEKGTKQ